METNTESSINTGRDCELDDASTALMGVNSQSTPSENSLGKSRLRRRTICTLAIVTVVVVMICGGIAFVCLTDAGQPVRCFASDTFGLGMIECEHADSLASLSGISMSTPSNKTVSYKRVRVYVGCNGTQCNTTTIKKEPEYTQQELEWIAQGEHAWNIAYEILNDKKGWHKDNGKSRKSGVVHSKTYEGLGRISKLEGYLRASPAQLLDLFINQTESLPEWDSGTEACRVLQTVNDNLDIYYMITHPVAGGIISRRDYVGLRHWRTEKDFSMVASTGAHHPDMPEIKGLIRAHNKPGGMMFIPQEDKPGTILVKWCFGTDIGGWVPQWAVDRGIASSMITFLHNMQKKVDEMEEENQD